ncbi:hypothetical protein [Hymenobacter cheonanensis]|uniref:hypothetical protein n=1 Tax=Hymenobacter sp. CA2-7 TaxID=3063993 RepID=UPI0027129BB1|nr:hypothetical protein [Hymenobacter sp. CA2-7]MDO7884053.1 hypothetical protein [Hymenobacter sp. CA2-7]
MATTVAALLLCGGPARAASTLPATGKDTRPQARRGAARSAARAPARRLPTLVAASPPAAQPPAPATEAQPPQVCLAGLVLGADGQPCPGVCVFPTTNVRQIAVTNAQGAFQLQVPAHAALSLQAEYVGLGSTRLAVGAEPGPPVRIVLGR